MKKSNWINDKNPKNFKIVWVLFTDNVIGLGYYCKKMDMWFKLDEDRNNWYGCGSYGPVAWQDLKKPKI